MRLEVNGLLRNVAPEPERTLLYVLREELGLTGAKYGCGEGECGMCTVLLDGQPVHACVTRLAEVSGRKVTTIEGLSGDGLHPVQRAFLEEGALQCGYCTPGMILTASALLARNPRPDDAAIAAALEGNVCRCGAHPRILRAVKRAGAVPGAAVGEVPQQSLEADPTVPWDQLQPGAAPYFDVLGEGIVAVVPPGPSPRGLPRGGAWVHLGTRGMATAFTGKIEMGQGARTGLSLLVAEELRLPLEAVRLVMGDTDVVPWDVGTFGSMSTAIAGQDLRAAAAALRERLALRAARQWGIDRSRLDLEGGLVRGPDGRTAAYRALVEGLRAVEQATGAPPLTAAEAWTVAGRETPMLGRYEAVTGKKRFPIDLARPDLWHGRVLRPPEVGAKLRGADVSLAKALGATVVLEAGFVGVAAPSLHEASAALAAIRADWDYTPQPSEGELDAFLRSHPIEGKGWEDSPVHDVAGDSTRALVASPLRVEATYRTAYIAHVPAEARSAIAEWRGERVSIWTGTQRPFGTRAAVAAALGIPDSRVHVVAGDMGDGFGGKQGADAPIEAARLARAAKHPVKVVWGRDEETASAYFRPAALVDVRAGAGKDGRLRAWEQTTWNAGAAALSTPYDVADRSVHFLPAESPLRQGPYRSLAAVANNFARESAMDELAAASGLDPLEFRLRNLGHDDRLAAVLRAAAERAGWSGRSVREGVGWGLACGFEKGGRVATCAEVDVRAGLRVLRLVTAFDCGAIVNPDGVRAQVEGAAIMGLGGALFEAIHFENGRILNGKLSRYRVPRFSDLPQIDAVLVGRPAAPSAGAGETPIIAIAPAIAAGCFAASGRRLRSLPLLAEWDPSRPSSEPHLPSK